MLKISMGWSNLGVAQFGLGQFDDALATFDRALAKRADDIGAMFNRGCVLQRLQQADRSMFMFKRVLAQNPGHVDALLNRGIGFMALDRPADALDCFARILAIEPNHAQAHFNEGLVRLQIGDFQRGWQKYEWRTKLQEFVPSLAGLRAPAWLGDRPLAGKTILLVGEQGLGDTLQMVRYVPLIAAAGATVILAVQPALKALLSGVRGVSAVVAWGEPLPAIDVHCSLMSLPLVFKTDETTMPAETPYIVAPPSRVAEWRDQLPSGPGGRVGVVWCGNPNFKRDYSRSMELAQFAPRAGR